MNPYRRIVDQFLRASQSQPQSQLMNETLLELLRSDDFDVFAQGVEIGRTMGYSDTKLLSYTSPLIMAPLFNQWSDENGIIEDHLGNPYWIRSLVIFEKLDKRYRKEKRPVLGKGRSPVQQILQIEAPAMAPYEV